MDTESTPTNVLPLNEHEPIFRRIRVRTLSEILADHEPPPPPIVDDGILPEESICLIYGKSKSRKTFLALNLGLGISLGRIFAGFRIPRPRKVLMISAEGGYYSLRQRIQLMTSNLRDAPTGNFAIIADGRLNLTRSDDLCTLENIITDIRPSVLGLDPLIKFHDGDENWSQEMIRILGALRTLTLEHNLSILLVHHTGKGDGQDPRGSSAIAGEYDSAISMIKVGNGVDHKLEFDLRHVETPAPWPLRFNTETLWFERPVANDVARLLLSMERLPISKADLARACVESGISTQISNAYSKIDRAVRGNHIVLVDGMYDCLP